MSPFILIALAALLGFIVGWFAHGPKESSGAIASQPAPTGPAVNPLVAELERLKQAVARLETHNAGLEAMVHGRDSALITIARRQAAE
jgi:hypothetical protein